MRQTPCFLSIILVTFLLSISGAKAQSNSEYHFRQQSVIDGASYGGAPVTVLPMSSLGSNGYGQWTTKSFWDSTVDGLSTLYYGGVTFYLLGNGLYKPSTEYSSTDLADYPGCIPAGIVDSLTFVSDPFPDTAGKLFYTQPPQIVTNLDGATSFAFQIDDSSLGITFIQLLPSDVSLDSIPNGLTTREILSSAEVNSATISSSPARKILTQPNYRDMFSIASDSEYCYIAWASSDHPVVPGDTEIWGAIVDLQTHVVTSPFFLGSGFRPSISCIKRQNRTGTPIPQFDLAYIKVNTLTGWPNLCSVTYNNGILDTNHLVERFYDPSGGASKTCANITHVCPLVSDVLGQTSTMHALYAIVQDGNPAPTGNTHLVEYVFHEPLLPGEDTAHYVDGHYVSDPAPVPLALQPVPEIVDQPITAFANPYDAQSYLTSGVYDQFHVLYQVNVITTPAGPPPVHRYPLLIARGHDNGTLGTTDTRLVLNQDTTGSLLQDPDNNFYVGAINQMGIHVHWFATDTGLTTHYYSRDTSRGFDEEIDENTLVTDRCTVKDGRTHGGMLGAMLDNGKQMTVYSNLSYGASDSVPVPGSKAYGLYQPWDSTKLNPYVGTLNFEGDSVQLTIGDSSTIATSSTPATLAVVPFFYFNFLDANQIVSIHGNFDYYGLNATHNSNHSNRFIMTPFTDGTTDYLGAGTIYVGNWAWEPPHPDTVIVDAITVPGSLNVHAGADLFIGPKGKLVTYQGNINVLDEPNLYPINVASGAKNASATGHITLLGQGEFADGTVSGNIPADTSVPGGPSGIIMSVDTGFRTFFTSGDPFQLHAEHAEFQNVNPLATSTIQFGHLVDRASSFWNILLDSSTFSAINLHEIDPDSMANFTVSNSTFENMHRRTIFSERDFLSTNAPYYDSITILNNNFMSIAPNWEVNSSVTLDSVNATVGIYLKNFNVQDSGDLPKTITVQGNHFTDTSNWSHLFSLVHRDHLLGFNQNPAAAAIAFENTTGNIIADTITDNSYFFGINLLGIKELDQLTIFKTNTFLCSDYIAHLHPPTWFMAIDTTSWVEQLGLDVNYHNGYIKLTTITDVEQPFTSGGDGHPNLVFDTIDARDPGDTSFHFAYTSAVIVNATTLNIADFSGIHGGDNDVAGFNTIRGYRGGRALLSMSMPNSIVNLGNSLDTGGEPFSNYGQNNIYYDSVGSPTIFALLINAGTSTNIGNLNHNFFGTGIDPAHGSGTCAPFCQWNAINTSELNANNITYDVPDSTSDTLINRGFFVDCGDSRATTRKKNEQNQSIEQPDTTSRCQLLFNKCLDYDESAAWQQLYDTGMYLVENYPCCSWTPGVFNMIGDAVGSLASGNCSLYNQYSRWLESVLYNCTTEQYFCACIQGIGYTYCPDMSPQDQDSTGDVSLAILEWLLKNDTSCNTPVIGPTDTIGLIQQQINEIKSDIINSWIADSEEGIHYPIDTTVPSLHDLGLDTLLERHFLYSVTPGTQSGPSIFTSVSASPNPVSTGTVISFGLSKQAYVKLELFDVLGHALPVSGFEQFFGSGNYEMPISMQDFPSGTYFARLTAYGQAVTIKLVKE